MSSSTLDKNTASLRSLVLSRFTPYRVVALGHAMSAQLQRAYSDEDITINEWRVLAVIAQKEAVAARDVVSLTPMDKMSVSRAVASLEAKGIAERRSSAQDRRVNTVLLTLKGRALFDRISALAIAYENDVLAELTEDERSGFDRILTKLSRKVGAAGCDST